MASGIEIAFYANVSIFHATLNLAERLNGSCISFEQQNAGNCLNSRFCSAAHRAFSG
ncbi:hypothetical protein [Rhizobium paknamense]|uniref:Uncharacterized protein n=1 Tax=Rhizobium paknamense TaxID=1206817 RepID=A0ABU0IJR7_9HYPH|nr:hypothetical protein [Rhizobium paknamense]MDQ0457883.1 hypothetical protein [Rhizobium paknamense]